MNKYLIKIIEEYILLKPKYTNELLKNTENLIIPGNDNWYYYDNYTVCSENYITWNNIIYTREYKIPNRHYFMVKLNFNGWSMGFDSLN